MKTLIAAALLLALASPAHAETRTCIGRVKIDVIKTHEELYPKGYKQFSIGNCVLESLALQKRALHICPIGSWCRIVGAYAGDAVIESIDSVISIDPYQEGMRDWREGLCLRARPYPDHSPEQERWRLGYHAGAKQYPKRDMAHCHLSSIKGLN